MTDRVTILNQLADAADVTADSLLDRAVEAVAADQGITPRRNAFADALAMLEVADALRDRAALEQQRLDAAESSQ